uniref:Uncharacterized protein n=1 Tax=Anguilla anguilla TaxID=7936 RepID=A0A0E9RM86_ANGAN
MGFWATTELSTILIQILKATRHLYKCINSSRFLLLQKWL